jgi:4-alpha-glucanotransferase
MKVKILLILAALGIIGFAVFLTGSALAEENPPYSSLIQKLVERFNLNPDEVQEVFEEHRGERRAKMEQHFGERLDQAVAEGRITVEQKEALLTKKAEMEAECAGFKELSMEERKEKMAQHQQEMKAWVEENGLDFFALRDLRMGGFKGGHFGGRGFRGQ